METIEIPPTQNIAPQPVVPVVKKPENDNKKAVMISIIVGIVLLGVGTGWILSGGLKQGSSGTPSNAVSTKSDKEAGLNIADTVPFDAEGTLESGGLSGEGTHHLIREGGPSQTVYLTSSLVDLESFVGKKVQIWGDTVSSKKTQWLMDVTKIKVTN